MKKTLLILAIFIASIGFASAQVLPQFQVGLKGGLNFLSLNTNSASSNFSSSNQSGYLAGVWFRFGALGFNIQPEGYFSSKTVQLAGGENQTFKSLDVPLLFGGKVGALGFGVRFYAGPVASFIIDKGQSFSDAAGDITSLQFKDQSFAVTGGIGIDVKRFSLDVRYEHGYTDHPYFDPSTNTVQTTKLNMFNVTLGISLVKL
jgi:hypothetical protein